MVLCFDFEIDIVYTRHPGK